MGTSGDFQQYRTPYQKNIDDSNRFEGHVASFIKNSALRFLQIVYSEKPIGQFRYEEDEEKTEIKIADRFAFQLDAADARPAIVAVRGPVIWQNLGMNQGMQELDMRTQEQHVTDLLSGSVGFSCISRVGLEAETIASDVFSLLKFFRRTLSRFGFFTIRSMSLGPEEVVETAGEPTLFLVNVLMQCQVQKRWVIEPKSAAELRKVVVSAFTNRFGDDEELLDIKTDCTDC